MSEETSYTTPESTPLVVRGGFDSGVMDSIDIWESPGPWEHPRLGAFDMSHAVPLVPWEHSARPSLKGRRWAMLMVGQTFIVAAAVVAFIVAPPIPSLLISGLLICGVVTWDLMVVP
jgi:hypothetical protein